MRFRVLIYLAVMCLFGCQPKVAVVDPELKNGQQALPMDRPVYMLEAGDEAGSTYAATDFSDAVISGLVQRGVRVLRWSNVTEDQRQPVANARLTLIASKQILTSTFRDKATIKSALADIQRATGAGYIAFSETNVFVGTPGGWDPNTGRVWDSTSTTSLKLTIVSLPEGSVAWQRELFIRAAATPQQIRDWTPKLFATSASEGAKR